MRSAASTRITSCTSRRRIFAVGGGSPAFLRGAGPRAGFSTWYVPESRVMHIGGQSTAVKDESCARLPAYWFESRRRYFAVSFGLAHAMAIDAVAGIAHSLGIVKRALLRRRGSIPHYVRDLVRHSVLWKRNRNIPPVYSRLPRSGA